ncbi:furan-3-one reductase [Seminavis robusta]|uniref:Furan-3-one reductase n=1 Tax=Seminavis robusta TaxID=568900 RepID=A0A9N8H3D1_9STRA|nr:furan-3-one reductase [Seminavis robusta]|eukprot:Sro24_g016390.1 furan-3-one reductase (389) ;mRNA; f:62029-63195
MLAQDLPKSMKAAQGKNYGDIDEMLSVQEGVAVPKLDDEYNPVGKIHPLIKYATRQDRKTHMIIKTLAVALAPGDCRVLSGKTKTFQGPPSFPYIPGGDVAGIVVETAPDETYFQKGDVVAARFTVAPRDAMAEYARVSTSVCEKVSDTKKISPAAAAALASASPAVCVSDHIRPNERVLILGAGGGVGSHLCQLARYKGASYVCGVSRDTKRLLEAPLSCDDAIDYTKENILDSPTYQKEPFDTIIDLAAGGTWLHLLEGARQNRPSIVKPASQGGRYITITPDAPTFEGRSLFALLWMFLFKPTGRWLWSRLFSRRKMPTFTSAMALPDTREIMTRTLKLAEEGKLQAVIDGPYPLTTEGVCKAFRTLESRHPKGKVVVQVADLED